MNQSFNNGFGLELSYAERQVLQAFINSVEVVFPSDCGLTDDEVKTTLTQLNQKRIIVGRSPYRLTKKGKQVVKHLQEL